MSIGESSSIQVKDAATMHVLYLGWFVRSDRDRQYYGIERENPAGLKKKENMISALSAADVETTILSPLLFHRWRPQYFKKRRTKYGSSPVIFPATVSLPLISVIVTFFTTLQIMFRIHRKRDIDAIIIYNFRPESIPVAAVFCLITGVPVVVEYEDYLPEAATHWLVAQTAQFLELLGKTVVSGAVVVTTNLMERLSTDNYCVVRGIISQSEFDESETIGRENHQPRVVYSGRIDHRRGAFTLLEAISNLDCEFDLSFTITGYGDEELTADLQRQIDEISCQDVEFYGYLDYEEYRTLLQSATILINPQETGTQFSRYSFPSKVLEYMATGNLVLSTKVSDIELFAEQRVVLTGDTPEEMATTFETVLEQEQNYQTYGQNARNWIRKRCLPESVGKRVREVIRDA